MRSSIACVRCRRSKIKCVNNGIESVCRSCETSGRECTYPLPTDSLPRKVNSSGRVDKNHDGERRKRPRKSVNSLFPEKIKPQSKDNLLPLVDALESNILTASVWQELFDIFHTHYSADLPFLHSPTFLKPLRQAPMNTSSEYAAANQTTNTSVIRCRPPGSHGFLLAFLALTSRFHPGLVAHHTPAPASKPPNALAAAEYYASAAHAHFTTNWNNDAFTNLEQIQGLLMLGLHEWGMCRGARAWILVGSAIRTAQAIGLQYEAELDDQPLSRALALEIRAGQANKLPIGTSSQTDADAMLDGDNFMRQEIRRRTFWSCYIMDRYLSSGKYRPNMLHAQELRIQLPVSERSYLFGEPVRTLLLDGSANKLAPGAEKPRNRMPASRRDILNGRKTQGDHSSIETIEVQKERSRLRLETGSDEGLVSCYIRLLEVYGKIVKWSCAGGRRTEQHPPWNFQSSWHGLRLECLDFKNNLPRQFWLTAKNTQAHISMKTSTPYILMHIVFSLCQIMLNREYVPFIPLRCSKPEGPLDPPMFPPDQHTVPPQFWETSARDCFRSAREIIDLVWNCHEWGVQVETPIVGFATYTVAFVGVYCMNFPWMDPDGHMCIGSSGRSDLQPNSEHQSQSPGSLAAKRSLEMLGQMRGRLHMARGWLKTIKSMHRYFSRMKSDYTKNNQHQLGVHPNNPDRNGPAQWLSLRDGGGGLVEYKYLERTLNDFGSLDNEDEIMDDADQTEPPDGSENSITGSRSPATSNKPGSEMSGRPEQGPQSQSDHATWKAVNETSTKVIGPVIGPQTGNNGGFRAYENYPMNTETVSPSTHESQRTSLVQSQPLQYPQPHDSLRARWVAPGLGTPSSLPLSSPTVIRSPYEESTTQTAQAATPTTSAVYSSPAAVNVGYNSTLGHGDYRVPMATASTDSTMRDPAGQALQRQDAWNDPQKEEWLNALHTRLSADDVAAFVNGHELDEWVSFSASHGFSGGWLGEIWGSGR